MMSMKLAGLEIEGFFLVLVHEEENDMLKDDINKRSRIATEEMRNNMLESCRRKKTLVERSRQIMIDHGRPPAFHWEQATTGLQHRPVT